VWNACGKVPQIADADIIDEVAPILIDGREASAPIEHIGPLGLFVPVQFAYATRLQAHIHPCQRRRDGQFTHRSYS
jgi:hypothetical protein